MKGLEQSRPFFHFRPPFPTKVTQAMSRLCLNWAIKFIIGMIPINRRWQ
jgi:hypothetical protein